MNMSGAGPWNLEGIISTIYIKGSILTKVRAKDYINAPSSLDDERTLEMSKLT